MNDKNKLPILLQWREGQLANDLEPIVLEYNEVSRRKKKRKAGVDPEEGPEYSRNLRDVQEAEGNLVRIARKASRSVTKAIDTYDKERSKSAEKKKDGAIEDFPQNVARAMSDAMKESADLPIDVVEAVTTRNLQRQLRRNLKRASRTLRIFRI